MLATGAGAELAVAATKTYTSQLAALAAFWAAWLDDEMSRPPSPATSQPRCRRPWRRRTRCAPSPPGSATPERLIVAGRGFNYATALETALKLKETCYLAAMPFSAADLLHGPIAMVEPQYPVLLFAPGGATRDGMLELQDELRRARRRDLRGGRRATAAGGDAPASSLLPRPLPEALSPLTAVIPGQLLAYHLSLARGLDPDRPRGLSKVTRTDVRRNAPPDRSTAAAS